MDPHDTSAEEAAPSKDVGGAGEDYTEEPGAEKGNMEFHDITNRNRSK